MKSFSTAGARWIGAIGLAALIGLTSACAGPTVSGQPTGSPQPASASKDGEAPALKATVVAQQTQIAGLKAQVKELQNASAAQTQPQQQAAPAIPTLMPASYEVSMDGSSKGSKEAKVTITEYSDYQ